MKNILENEKKDTSWVNRFEKNFKDKLNSKYAIAVNSGTSGLHAALMAAGVSEGSITLLPRG